MWQLKSGELTVTDLGSSTVHSRVKTLKWFSLGSNLSRCQQGSVPYLIEAGGSSYTGSFGYLTAFQEMMDQVS